MSTVDFPKIKFSPLRLIFVECPRVTSNGVMEVKFTTELTCLLKKEKLTENSKRL
jgi:hypothetical protein